MMEDVFFADSFFFDGWNFGGSIFWGGEGLKVDGIWWN